MQLDANLYDTLTAGDPEQVLAALRRLLVSRRNMPASCLNDRDTALAHLGALDPTPRYPGEDPRGRPDFQADLAALMDAINSHVTVSAVTGASSQGHTVAVDFDGVVHTYTGWNGGALDGDPLPGALEALNEIREQGTAVFVHTARPPLAVAEWLWERGVPATVDDRCLADHEPVDDPCPGVLEFWDATDRVLVTQRKLPALLYIDDRAHRFTDWKRARAVVAQSLPGRTRKPGQHRTFVLERDVDHTGVSGTGPVAEGVEFSDGTVALRWMGSGRSTAVWPDLEEALSVHGHSGSTRVVWTGEEETRPGA